MVWDYLKDYTALIPGVRHLEGELQAIFPRRRHLFVSTAARSLTSAYAASISTARCSTSTRCSIRWLSPRVVRPALADYRGFAIVSGTSNGDDHFHALKLRAEDDPIVGGIRHPDHRHWRGCALLRGSRGDAQRHVARTSSPAKCSTSFEAPVEGAYYNEQINALQIQNRVTKVSPDLNTGVITAWDLGIRHLQCIWLFQIAGRELHWIDYIEGRGKKLSHYTELLNLKAKAGGFTYRAHLLPHDVEVKELTTGYCRRHELTGLLDAPVITVPNHSTEDGITATRGCLGISWFDAGGDPQGPGPPALLSPRQGRPCGRRRGRGRRRCVSHRLRRHSIGRRRLFC